MDRLVVLKSVVICFIEKVSAHSISFACFIFSSFQDVGAFFEEGMWLRYNFHSPGTSMKDLVSRTLLSSTDPETTATDLNLNKEELSFSFSTTKSPCVLLYISSYTQDFMAVLVKPSGKQLLWALSIEGTTDNNTRLTCSWNSELIRKSFHSCSLKVKYMGPEYRFCFMKFCVVQLFNSIGYSTSQPSFSKQTSKQNQSINYIHIHIYICICCNS